MQPDVDKYQTEWHPDFEDEPDLPHDPAVDRAKLAVRTFFSQNQTSVFYQQQIAVILEDEFFHWITTTALGELVAEGRLLREEVPLPAGTYPLRVYHLPSHRNWRRQAYRLVEQVAQYSSPDFARAVGRQGEMMFDAALPQYGFVPRGRDVREWQGRRWDQTEHDLDRVFEADGRFYGIEIKNTLKYIPKSELEIKMAMCRFLGLRPLFIMRFAPKTYTYDLYRAGGFALLFKDQLYPFGNERLAGDVRAELRLPVHCPPAVPDGHVVRFVNWHRLQIDRERAALAASGNADSASNRQGPVVSD